MSTSNDEAYKAQAPRALGLCQAHDKVLDVTTGFGYLAKHVAPIITPWMRKMKWDGMAVCLFSRAVLDGRPRSTQSQ